MVVDGEASSFVKVTSGVPQGTVLGPLMFLLFINDIHENLDSTLRLFADDALLYRSINTSDHGYSFKVAGCSAVKPKLT